MIALSAIMLALTACGTESVSEPRDGLETSSSQLTELGRDELVPSEGILSDELSELAELLDRLGEIDLSLGESTGTERHLSEMVSEVLVYNPTPLTWRRAYSPTVLSSNWEDLQLEINGDVYSFPMSYSELIELGWTMDDRMQNPYSLLGPSRGIIARFVHYSNSEIRVPFRIRNMDSDTRRASDSFIMGVDIQTWEPGSPNILNDIIVLPGGVEFGKVTLDEILDLYGEPERKSTQDDHTRVEYLLRISETEFQHIRFDVSVYDSGGIRGLSMHWDATPKGFVQSIASHDNVFNIETYVTPLEFGNDPSSRILKIDNALFLMPFPVNELINIGWNLQDDVVNRTIAGETSGDFITIVDTNYIQRTIRVTNYSSMSAVPANTRVTFISSNHVNIILPGNIKVGTSRDDLEAALTNASIDFYADDSRHARYFIYTISVKDGGRFDNIQIYVDRWEDEESYNTVTRIDVSISNSDLVVAGQ